MSTHTFIVIVVVCLAECRRFGTVIPHGGSYSPRQCAECRCDDGRLHCDRTDPETECPTLKCPVEQQVQEEGRCCKVCKGKCELDVYAYKHMTDKARPAF